MPWIDGAAGQSVLELTFRTDAFKEGLVFRMQVVSCQIGNALVDLKLHCRIFNHLTDDCDDIDEHHRYGMASAWDISFRRKESGSVQHALDVFQHVERLLGVLAVAGGFGIFCHCHCGETFREDVAPLLDWSAFCRDREEHVAVRVNAMILNEVNAALGCFEPLRLPFDIVVDVGCDEAEPPLEPHRLGAVHESPVAVYASIDSAVYAVEAVLHPERHYIAFQRIKVMRPTFQ